MERGRNSNPELVANIILLSDSYVERWPLCVHWGNLYEE